MIKGANYQRWIEDRLMIVNKELQEVPFKLNSVQSKYLLEDGTGRDLVLKARQQGFSSLILALFTADFLLKDNVRNVIVADISDNASDLLDRVKRYISSYELITGNTVPLKYNSKYELYNTARNSRYTIGTADNSDFGRSKTITNLHLSEFAFYPNPEKLFAGAMQAVVPDGRIIVETTANGFNGFKKFWDESVLGQTGFKPLFYGASSFYSSDFLESRRGVLGYLFKQEYPDTPEEAFLTSGELFFNKEALSVYMFNVKEPISVSLIYE